MLISQLENRDITETLARSGESDLEDAIFLALDKIHALCRVQAELEQMDGQVSGETRFHFALVLEEQVATLRKLLDKQFA